LQEALVNAFCHRDYSRCDGAVSLAIYDYRLEIWSDGTLPFGTVTEVLRRDHPSRLRNPLIADVFYRRGLIDRWGSGAQKIIELCVRAGHPEPEFGEQSGAVWVRFWKSDYIAPHRVTHDVAERQRRVLQVLSAAERLAFREIRRRLPIPSSDRTLRDDLIHLKRLRLIASEGRGRGVTWNLLRTRASRRGSPR
jgi:ATP-dependent DNA helicase RecG